MTLDKVRGLGDTDGLQPTWLIRIEVRGTTHPVVLKAGPLNWAAGFISEAAGMAFAHDHGLRAPQLIAADLSGGLGVLAILSTALPGNSDIPDRPSPQRLWALGAAAARLHAIPLTPRPDLPLRRHHIPHDDYRRERRWAASYQAASEEHRERVFEEIREASGWPADAVMDVVTHTRTTQLIRAAEERLEQIPEPQGDTVFVHADLHMGNTLWDGDELVGIVDWDSAGAGKPGVDLGSLRLDAALHYGLAAADEVVIAWEEASGQRARDIPYWDVVTALNTPATLGSHFSGQPDRQLRRDSFLCAALARLDSH